MKICPSCRSTYSDDSLNFCLDDGAVLTLTTTAAESPETLVMHPRPSASVAPTVPSGGPTGWSTPNQGQFSMQPPRKKSRTWLWVLGIFTTLILVCGGGFVGVMYYVGSVADKIVNNASSSNSSWTKANSSKTNSGFPSPSPQAASQTDDVDMSDWTKEPTVWGTTQYDNGEMIMASKDKAYYFVQLAPDKYETEDATTRVTVRNVDNANTNLGYGLVVHSDPNPLTKDYAFLIDAKRTRYRIVQHSPSEERTIKPWTTTSAIKDGVQENALEVRDKSGELQFFINNQMVSSFKNTNGPKSGVPGLYSGDGIKIGFKRLQIAK
ncbi:MAG TPA: hypothetical protein VGQ55_02365 [Pyrinomonadaceae bacterium]|jgi:hypothetical protein|nr:hypothetical protein [Pyrinomonadaceae bacterium]